MKKWFARVSVSFAGGGCPEQDFEDCDSDCDVANWDEPQLDWSYLNANFEEKLGPFDTAKAANAACKNWFKKSTENKFDADLQKSALLCALFPNEYDEMEEDYNDADDAVDFSSSTPLNFTKHREGYAGEDFTNGTDVTFDLDISCKVELRTVKTTSTAAAVAGAPLQSRVANVVDTAAAVALIKPSASKAKASSEKSATATKKTTTAAAAAADGSKRAKKQTSSVDLTPEMHADMMMCLMLDQDDF